MDTSSIQLVVWNVLSTLKIIETAYIFQALLSAHDTVSLRDYEPDLPALPNDLPEDEEAMRIVCLVKNNQPLVSMTRKRSGRQI